MLYTNDILLVYLLGYLTHTLLECLYFSLLVGGSHHHNVGKLEFYIIFVVVVVRKLEICT